MNDNKNNKIFKVIIIILIILLLLFNIYIYYKIVLNGNNSKLSQSNNIDIFEIKCDDNNCSNPVTDSSKTDSNISGSSYSNSNSTKKDSTTNSNITDDDNTNTEDDDDVVEDNIKVKDNNIFWSSTSNLKIFSNPLYNNDSVIAPESSNTYKFMIRNKTAFDVKYSISFIETNNYNINMKYRLKKDNNYVVSDWVDYDELDLSDISLAKSNTHTYYLEWKWFSSDNDTSIGNTLNTDYKLDISITATEVNN